MDLYGLSLMEGLKSELKLYEETSVASLAGRSALQGTDRRRDRLRVRFRFVEKRLTKNSARGIVVEALDWSTSATKW